MTWLDLWQTIVAALFLMHLIDGEPSTPRKRRRVRKIRRIHGGSVQSNVEERKAA